MSLLPEGHGLGHGWGRDVTRRTTIGALRGLLKIASTSYGPRAAFKLVSQASCSSLCGDDYGTQHGDCHDVGDDALSITAKSSRIFGAGGAVFAHPVSRIMVQLVSGRSGGDCGLFALIFALNLYLYGLEDNMNPIMTREGYYAALNWCEQYLESPSCPCRVNIEWDDTHSLVALLMGVIGTKAVSLCKAVVLNTNLVSNSKKYKAFITAIPASTSCSLVPTVRLLGFLGHVNDTQMINGALLDVAIEKHSLRHPTHEQKVILFCDNVQPPAISAVSPGCTGEKVHVKWEMAGNFPTSDESQLETFVTHMQKLNVGVVASQKTIHPRIRELLISAGIVPLERLSIVHVEAFRQVTGASFQPNISQFFVNTHTEGYLQVMNSVLPSLGAIGSMNKWKMNNKTFLMVEPSGGFPCQNPCSTLVVFAPTQFALDELQAAVHSALTVLNSVLHTPHAYVGAGCFETCLSACITNNLANNNSVHPLMKPAIQNFARALDQVAACIDQSLPPHFFETEMHQANSTNHNHQQCGCGCGRPAVYGWSVPLSRPIPHTTNHQNYQNRNQQPEPAQQHHNATSQTADTTQLDLARVVVLDPGHFKLEALRIAVDTVASLLPVDNILESFT
ncbi:McKusick-Kaufman syndrome protein [Pelomyxa schiedti]|nr:McKusick-Kaufman syndrome protein [Pelomyxa schiedti]